MASHSSPSLTLSIPTTTPSPTSTSDTVTCFTDTEVIMNVAPQHRNADPMAAYADRLTERLGHLSWQLGSVETQLSERQCECELLTQQMERMRDELDASEEERRNLSQQSGVLQAQNLVLQNEILILQGDIRHLVRTPCDQAGQSEKPAEHGVKLGATTPHASTTKAPSASTAKESSASTTRAISMSPTKDPSALINQVTQASAIKASHALRECSSFPFDRSEDAFATPISKQQPPRASSVHSPSSRMDKRISPEKSGPASGPQVSKALKSTNWRQRISTQQAFGSIDLKVVREKCAQLFSKFEEWVDRYTCIIHTSVRSQEQRTAQMIKALDNLVGNFDLEMFFLNMHKRKLLVLGYVNRSVLEPLFNEKLRESHEETMTFSRAEADRMAVDISSILQPIIPMQERAAAQEELCEMVKEAFGAVSTMRCMPRAWRLEFDAPGQEIDLGSMAIRNAELQGKADGGELEAEYAVVLGVTPHLVSVAAGGGGMTTPEELMKAEVLVHHVGQSFFERD